MTFQNRLKQLREENNLTQLELAQKFNITSQTISQYERGIRTPDFNLLNSITDFFGVSVDYLLGRTDIRNFNDNNASVDKEESSLIDDYKKLNSIGKKEAEKRVKELTLIPFYVEEKVVSLAAHNDHLDDPDEKEKILDDFNNMDKW